MKQHEIQQAYETIKSGGLAIIPSRVGYTLLGNSDQAIEKMYRIKGRPLTKPCVILTKYDFLFEIARVPARHTSFIEAIDKENLLCGFILKRKYHSFFSSFSRFTDMNSQKPDGTSCFVIHGGDYIEYLVDRSVEDRMFVVGSSANQSGTGNEGVFSRIPEHIRAQVDYALDDDEYVHREYNPITRAQGVMVDLTGNIGVVIREGLQTEKIADVLERHNTQVLNQYSREMKDELL